MTLTGLGGTYSCWNDYTFGATASPATWAALTQTSWMLQNGAYLGQSDVDIQIGAGGLRTYKGSVLDATSGYLLLSQGKNTDTTSKVSGLTITFDNAAGGWFELAGFA